jgi:hypothetical protein
VAHLDKMGLAKDKKEKNCEGLALGGGSATSKGQNPSIFYFLFLFFLFFYFFIFYFVCKGPINVKCGT